MATRSRDGSTAAFCGLALWLLLSGPPAPRAARLPVAQPARGTGAQSAPSVRPLSASARSWIGEHRALIRRTAQRLGIPDVALAGIVAAERTLLHDRYDAVADALFRAYFATLPERALRTWAAAQEESYQNEVRRGEDPGLGRLKNPYLWSVGPAQVSFRNALFYEPRLARLEGRAQRTVSQIVRAVLEPEGSLSYAAVILLEAEEAYARYAGLDLRGEPGVLATLYHLGSPARRALRLGEANRRRELRGEAPAVPRLNEYGAFVEAHVDELESLLR
ncbi:MAG: DUF1402 family protein [Gemmatimonadota bacterium]